MAGVQGVRVLGAKDPGPCLQHLTAEIAGGCVAAAEPQIESDLLHAATVRGQGSLSVRQQRGERGPAARLVRVVRDRGLDQGGGGVLPPITHLVGHLIARDGLHQPVHQDGPISSRADQRIPAQRRHRIPRGQLILQQRQQRPAHLRTELPGQPRAVLQQQPQRDRFGRAERQQPQQRRRHRTGVLHLGKRQRPGRRYRPGVPGRLPPAQQVRPPLAECGQVGGQAVPSSLDVGGGLLQRQRQPAHRLGQARRGLMVRIPGTGGQEPRGGLKIEDRHLHRLPRRPQRVAAGDQHPPGPGRGQEPLHRCPVRRVVEHQQPLTRERGEHPMHRRHRVPRIRATSRAPSWAASSPNPAASTVGSSAANCQAAPTSAR